jgi:periplasmic copper chaperone A
MFSKLSPLCVGLVMLLTACSQAPGLQVDNPRVRDLLPNRDTTAGYFTIRNNTAKTVTLVSARSPAARAIEMHKTVVTEDRVGMRRIKEVPLPAGEQLEFAPGGLHLMIFGVSEMSDPFPITLLFADGQEVDVAFTTFSN